jgi:tetratricopeptide (TPR) repeat protein
MKYKGSSKSPPEISEELGIDYLIEPLYVKSADQVMISATLINAPENYIIGAEDSEGDYKNLFRLLNEVSQAIAGRVETELTTKEQERYTNVRQVEPRALELYLRGYSLLNKHKKIENNEAIGYFLKSIAIDSNFALPYVGLAIGYGQFMYWGDLPLDEGVPKVKKLIDKALQIDDQLAETYQALGAFRLWQLWEWEGAGEAFQRAKDLNPNLSGFSGSEYSWYLITMGYVDEAITEAERLIQVDPLFYTTRFTVGIVYYFSREYDKAIELIQRTIALDPGDGRAYEELSIIYEQVGRYDDAHQRRLTALKHAGESPGLIAKYDSLYTELGPKAYPTWLLMKYKKQDNWLERNPYKAAWIYARMGEIERSLDWLETGYEKKVGDMVTINIDPKWDMLREEPRFQDIVARMNFPD